MILIDVQRNSSQTITGFTVSGHAAAGIRGQDIVCAGVSALTQAAVMGVERHLGREIHLQQTEECQLAVELVTPADELTEAIFMTMILGLREIAQIYPKNVRIVEHRR